MPDRNPDGTPKTEPTTVEYIVNDLQQNAYQYNQDPFKWAGEKIDNIFFSNPIAQSFKYLWPGNWGLTSNNPTQNTAGRPLKPKLKPIVPVAKGTSTATEPAAAKVPGVATPAASLPLDDYDKAEASRIQMETPAPPNLTFGQRDNFIPMVPVANRLKPLSPNAGPASSTELTPRDNAFLYSAPKRPGAAESDTQYNKIDMAINEYSNQLDDMNKSANIVDGAKALGNVASFVTAMNLDDPQDLVAPVVKAPTLISPGQYVRQAQRAELDKQVNTSNRILSETGKSEAIVGNTANAMEATNKIATETIGMDIDVANQQLQLDANASNTNEMAKMDAYNKNIERKLQYNMLKGQGMTEAMNALGEQGTNYINRLGQTAYGKWQAKMSGEEARMMSNYQLTQSLFGSKNNGRYADSRTPVKDSDGNVIGYTD